LRHRNKPFPSGKNTSSGRLICIRKKHQGWLTLKHQNSTARNRNPKLIGNSACPFWTGALSLQSQMNRINHLNQQNEQISSCPIWRIHTICDCIKFEAPDSQATSISFLASREDKRVKKIAAYQTMAVATKTTQSKRQTKNKQSMPLRQARAH